MLCRHNMTSFSADLQSDGSLGVAARERSVIRRMVFPEPYETVDDEDILRRLTPYVGVV